MNSFSESTKRFILVLLFLATLLASVLFSGAPAVANDVEATSTSEAALLKTSPQTQPLQDVESALPIGAKGVSPSGVKTTE